MILSKSKLFLATIKPGMILHKQSYEDSAKLLRWAMNKWLARICKNAGVPVQCVWGNHDALIVRKPAETELFVGESTALHGTIATPVQHYADGLDSGKWQIRLYRALISSPDNELLASMNWFRYINGRPYNFGGFPRLIIKSLFFDWSDSKIEWMKKIGDKAAGWEWADWCTQGVADAFMYNPPNLNIFQTLNPTPLTTEQVAGEHPHKPGKKITLKLVWDSETV